MPVLIHDTGHSQRNSFKGTPVNFPYSLTADTKLISNLLKSLSFPAPGQDVEVSRNCSDISPHVIILHECTPFVKCLGQRRQY